jgi:hypothetical protein
MFRNCLQWIERPKSEALWFDHKAYPSLNVSVQIEAAKPPLPGPQISLAARAPSGNWKSDFLKN